MAGRTLWRELRNALPAERRARIEARAARTLEGMHLRELRRALQMSQVRVAEQLGIGQAAVSRLERRTDVYLSTLRNYVRALGGDLRIVATFGSSEIEIKQFASPRRLANGRRKKR